MKLQEVIDCLKDIIDAKEISPDDEVVVCVRPDVHDYTYTWNQYDFDIYIAFEVGKRVLVFDSNAQDQVLTKVEDKANYVAEYAELPEDFTFRAEPTEKRTECWLHWAENTSEPQRALCNLTWLMGNLKNCPDKCKASELLAAVTEAHPDKIRKPQ